MPKDKHSLASQGPGKELKERKRMVVEEIPPVETTAPVEEIKEKVEELQGLTQDIGASVEKSTEVQQQIAKAAEKVEPNLPLVENKPAEVNNYAPPYQSSKGPGAWVILVPGVLLLGALLGGIFFYEKGIQNQTEATPTPEATTEATVTPSASPSAKLDLTKYPINVQNGSGIPGTASSAKDLLTKGGFKVSTAGNAATYDYTDTIIETKADVPADFVTKLTTTLSGIYKVGTPKSLPHTSKDEVVVIIGSSKSQ